MSGLNRLRIQMISWDRLDSQLKILDASIRKCNSCPEREHFPGTLPTIQFRNQNGILFVGRDPARDGWRESGRPFRRIDGSLIPSGSLFNKHLKVIGLDVDSINYCELVKCYSKNAPTEPPTRQEIANCGRWLRQQIESVNPSCIVPLGKEAAWFFVRRLDKLASVVGKDFYYREFPVIPLWHPSTHNRRHNSENLRHMKIVDKVARGRRGGQYRGFG